MKNPFLNHLVLWEYAVVEWWHITRFHYTAGEFSMCTVFRRSLGASYDTCSFTLFACQHFRFNPHSLVSWSSQRTSHLKIIARFALLQKKRKLVVAVWYLHITRNIWQQTFHKNDIMETSIVSLSSAEPIAWLCRSPSYRAQWSLFPRIMLLKCAGCLHIRLHDEDLKYCLCSESKNLENFCVKNRVRWKKAASVERQVLCTWHDFTQYDYLMTDSSVRSLHVDAPPRISAQMYGL